MSGFDPALEFNQTAETIMNLRLLNSFVPGSLTLLCLLLLYKYPLNKQRVQDIKEELRLRRIAQHEAES